MMVVVVAFYQTKCFASFQNVERSNVRMFERLNVQLFACSILQMFECSIVRKFEQWYIRTLHRLNGQTFKHLNESSNIQRSNLWTIARSNVRRFFFKLESFRKLSNRIGRVSESNFWHFFYVSTSLDAIRIPWNPFRRFQNILRNFEITFNGVS